MIRRFHNQQLRIPQPNHRDSITKLTRFHNQNLTTSQTKSQDSTTTLPQFHNRNVAIHSIPPPWSVRTKSSHPWCLKDPTPLVSAHKVFTSMMIPPPRSGLTQSSHPWYLKDPTPLVGAYTVFTSMTSQRSHPLGQCVQSLQIHDIPKIPPPGSVLTQSSHPWFLRDPTPLVSAYKVFTSTTSQRSHPLGQCVQRLHIHDILKIPPRWSGLTQSSHPWYLKDPTPLVGAYTVFTSMISQRSHPLGQCVQSLQIHDAPPPWSGLSQPSHPAVKQHPSEYDWMMNAAAVLQEDHFTATA